MIAEGYVWTVAAAGRAALTSADAPAVRGQLQATLASEKRSINLKNTDDQNVAGLLAVRNACRQVASDVGISKWGVLAAPRTPGRTAITTCLERYQSDGAWGVSPHVIPHCSLHSLAGLLSVALDIHGPNLGVGGVTGAEGELWLVASSWMSVGLVSALWVVLSGWTGNTSRAVALGLKTKGTAMDRSLTYFPSCGDANAIAPSFSLESLDRMLALGDSVPLRSRWSLPGGAMLEWRSRAAEGRVAA